MKRNSRTIWLALLICCLAGLISSCDDDDTLPNPFIGTWAVRSLSTDNAALNALLEQLLPVFPVPLDGITLQFDADRNLTVRYPSPDGVRTIRAAYAYDANTLALRFDVLPVPFNAFGIAVLTDTRLVLTARLSRETVEAVIRLLIREYPAYEPYLTPVLAEIDENGLKADFEFIKSGSSPEK